MRQAEESLHRAASLDSPSLASVASGNSAAAHGSAVASLKADESVVVEETEEATVVSPPRRGTAVALADNEVILAQGVVVWQRYVWAGQCDGDGEGRGVHTTVCIPIPVHCQCIHNDAPRSRAGLG